MEPRADDGDDAGRRDRRPVGLGAAMEPRADDGDDADERGGFLVVGHGRNGAPC